jgi:choline dehydrogenase-like flavoprotein
MGMSDPTLMYNINSVPQTNLQNRTIQVLAGKVVGGSSAVNAMMTVRGAAPDYDRWGSFFGDNSRWSWEGLLPYFRRALTFAPPNPQLNISYDTTFWGNTSGVYAGWPSFQFPGTASQMDAFRGVGAPLVKDSGSGQPGVFWYPTFMDPVRVERSYARTGHHDKATNRTNYHLVTGSKVTRIVLNGTTATGVSFVAVGSASTAPQTVVRARKEVILASGGIHSPQILQLSGIGPRQLLSAANISTVVDLAGVGQNFQDHPMVQASFQCTESHPTRTVISGTDKSQIATLTSIPTRKTSFLMPASAAGQIKSGRPIVPGPTPLRLETQPRGCRSRSSLTGPPPSRRPLPPKTTRSTCPPTPTPPSQPATVLRCSLTLQP